MQFHFKILPWHEYMVLYRELYVCFLFNPCVS